MLRLLLLLLLFFCTEAQGSNPTSSADLHHRMRRLRQTISVLYVAAHPDDENTRLITWMSKEKAYRTSYVSLTRGDGGQNLIGSELGVELGLIRTRELMSAREIDGGTQYFTSAVDFGYSKTSDETLRKWNHDRVLEDLVRVIRTVQPDVIICRFPPDKRAGHGHHAASAILAEEAFRIAGDSAAYSQNPGFPSPWQARRIVWNTFRFGSNNTITANQPWIDAGGFDPISGYSNGELAAMSRSQHKSQGFGVALQRGILKEYFTAVSGDTVFSDPFEHLQDRWDTYPNGGVLARQIEKLIDQFDFLHPDASLPELLRLRSMMLEQAQDPWIQYKINEVELLIGGCMGLWTSAYSLREHVVVGDTFSVDVQVLIRNNVSASCRFSPLAQGDTMKKMDLIPQQISSLQLVLRAPNEPSQPYWLEGAGEDGCFGRHSGGMSIEPWSRPPVTIPVLISLGDQTLLLEIPVEYKRTDPVKGELVHEISITPILTGDFEYKTVVFSSGSAKTMQLNLTYHGNVKDSFQLIMNAGNGWICSTDTLIAFDKESRRKQVSLLIRPSDFNNSGSGSLLIRYVDSQGRTRQLHRMREIEYAHIPKITWFPECGLKMTTVNLDVKPCKIVYIEGAGDEVAGVLKQIGYEVIVTDAEGLMKTDLRDVTAIVTGIRAYNTDKKLPEAREKMMQFVRNGGRLIVQYNTNSNLSPGSVMAPSPFIITRNRVTEEDAPVTMSDTSHTLFNHPNRIGPNDFRGWIQERGLYFAGEIGSNYTDLLRMADTGEEPVGGSLIYTELGKGMFIYTGLAFFRQLPNGNPGAIRLFSNLIGH
ncbi:MAG: PIG-L family deacetylase [Sphingobacteriales bacterium]|nr:PIG-L family deacetylase [Sphingobacteriales bacterium]